ncbi:MAG: zeta toxin family protein [Gammaproteobacteria bacterium]|nr:zeta toxin family protein [Gammaproteobacteria bacterium]
MGKIVIVDTSEGTRTPFLRGLLTSSLIDAGLPFDESYELASCIRQTLSTMPEITTGELRQLVVQELGKLDSQEYLENYNSSESPVQRIKVINRQHEISSFSLARHCQSLQSTGLSMEQAKSVSQLFVKELEESGKAEIHADEIGHRTYLIIKKQLGREAAQRYFIWIDYTRSGRPLILLIGGATGCGKSTVATEVAHRLGIIRTQSTDMLREVMRMLIPERLLPTLHTSSFNAWQRLPGHADDTATHELIIMGYKHQTELVSVPCEAVIQRALKERVSLILEGIHVSPALLQRLNSGEDAVIVPVMLAALKQDQLKQRLQGRGIIAPERESSQYLSHFEQIWELQSYLLSEADKSDMEIINNDDKELTTEWVMHAINKVLAKGCKSQIEDVFGRH